MSDLAIRAVGIGKQYHLGARVERYRTLADSVMQAPVRALQSLRRARARRHDEVVWALRDVTFDIARGDVVGLIGRNGAGKSTLLKVLSRITEPTVGYADVSGRVGSLLEVGTGFHPELTGRENVFLNGAILGMPRRDIARKFDEIVEFAGVPKYIDTAVKHYSSGMYLRLAFAVAAHMEPDILMVDEVLAVGDAEFQRKCLGKMDDVAREGRTVLFVSHNMAAMRSLCTRGVLVERGAIGFSGEIGEAIYRYTTSLQQDVTAGTEAVSFTRLKAGRDGAAVAPGDPLEVSCVLRLREPIERMRVFCIIQDGNGDMLVHSRVDGRELGTDGTPGAFALRLQLPPLWLRPGAYSAHFKLVNESFGTGKARFISDSVMLDVVGDLPPELGKGMLAPQLHWNVDALDDA